MNRTEWLAAYRDMRIRNGNWRLITWQRFRLHGLIWKHDFFATGTEPRRTRFRLACRVTTDAALPGLRLHNLQVRLEAHRFIRQLRAAA